MEKVFSSPHINLYLHPGPHNTLELEWLDFVNSAELQAALLEALNQARRYGIKSWLADNRLIRAIRPKDFDWMGEHIIMPLDALGVQRLAVVESQDAMNRLGVSMFLSSIIPNTRIVSKYFDSLNAARDWSTQAF
jgi:hypothetical protein